MAFAWTRELKIKIQLIRILWEKWPFAGFRFWFIKNDPFCLIIFHCKEICNSWLCNNSSKWQSSICNHTFYLEFDERSNELLLFDAHKKWHCSFLQKKKIIRFKPLYDCTSYLTVFIQNLLNMRLLLVTLQKNFFLWF